MGSEDPALAIAARHALHDEELVVAFATDGDDAEDAARARTLVERCQACRDLHADVVAIGGALRSVPDAQAAAASRRAPRDFRLSVATANELRPGSVVLRLRDRIREAIASFGRPVGMSLASLGVVGLLLGTLTLAGSAGIGQAPEGAGLGGDAGAANASTAPGATVAPHLETPGTGGLAGQAGSPRETVRMSFDSLATAAPGSPAVTAATASDPAATPAASAPVVPRQGPGPAASTGPTLSALILVGSIVLLGGGVVLVLAGSRRREPISGR
jgi:hypothetical protein